MQNPHEKIERSLLKVIGWTVAVILVLTFGGIFGYRAFSSWQQRRLVAQGNAFVQQNDLKRANLNGRRIVQLNPENPDGYRILARVAEKTGSPSAIDLRRHVMEIGRATDEDLILLARDATRFDDPSTAESAISKLSPAAHNRADFHALLAEIAYARRDGNEMERELSEALRLDPANKDYTVRLAALQLNASDFEMSERGRQTLLELQKDPETRREATRHLAENAIRRKDFTTGAKFAKQLDSFPERTFSDRLLLLSALKGVDDPGYAQLLQDLETSALQDPESMAALITWMNGNAMSQHAIAWSAKLPPQAINDKLVAIALSDSYIAAQDWAGLQRLTKTGNWGNVDFLRSALAARALRELGNQPDSTAKWAEAVNKVSGNTRHTLLLADTVGKWNWRKEAIDLLWLAADDPLKGDEALQTLYAYFAKNGDTQNLYRVLLHRNARHPEDANVKNNLAALSLLLNMNRERGWQLAQEVYQQDPHNAAYASTYAFALYTKGENKKALQAMETLTDQQRRQPEIAAYYGIILAANGDNARAAEFLDLAQSATLLPEEKELVQRARRSIAQG